MFWNCLNHLTLLLRYSMQCSSVQLVPFCVVSFSSVCLFQFANKWIHSFVKQFDQKEAAAKVDSFTYDRQFTKLMIATGAICSALLSNELLNVNTINKESFFCKKEKVFFFTILIPRKCDNSFQHVS